PVQPVPHLPGPVPRFAPFGQQRRHVLEGGAVAGRARLPVAGSHHALPSELAFHFRWGAVNERRLAGRGCCAQLAFHFRWGAVNERRFVRTPARWATGVPFPLGGGKGTPVAGNPAAGAGRITAARPRRTGRRGGPRSRGGGRG